jgi:hypothetical protein
MLVFLFRLNWPLFRPAAPLMFKNSRLSEPQGLRTGGPEDQAFNVRIILSAELLGESNFSSSPAAFDRIGIHTT